MPIKRIVMVKRKQGLSPEEFRQGYENNHSRIAVKLFGHLWLSYRRNYLTVGHNFDIGSETAGPDDVGFDAISEFVVRDEAAMAEIARIGAENFDWVKEDEARWFDQAHCWTFSCETIEENLG